ncbi:oligosaccharide flippase family protein, partial [Acinetobacter baumannii]
MEHEGRAIRGVRIALLSNIAGVLLQTLIMALLARLVSAVDYGLLAGALVVIRLAQHLLSSGPER